jgi:hypothetical protein
MSYALAAREIMVPAATDLATIGSNLNEAHTAAAASTVAVPPAAADQVSATIANLFPQHGADYQALARQAAAFQEQFMRNVTAGAASYVSTEAANAPTLTSAAYNPLDIPPRINQAGCSFEAVIREPGSQYFRALFDPLFQNPLFQATAPQRALLQAWLRAVTGLFND